MATEKNSMSIRLNSTKGAESLHWLDEGLDDVSGGSARRLRRIQLLTLPFAPFFVAISFALGFELALTIVIFLTVISVESLVFHPQDLHECGPNLWTGESVDCSRQLSYAEEKGVEQSKEDVLVTVPYLYVILSRFRRSSMRESRT